MATVMVIAKQPLPGTVKTRLCPPCTPHEAAALAEAALADTLAAVAAARVRRRVLVLEGRPGRWLAPGFAVEPQAGGPFARRLAAAFAGRSGPALLVAMDTPQVTPELLNLGLGRLERRDTDAVLGPTPDGGYWCIGLARPDPAAFETVPMSTPWTGRAQRARLDRLGLRTAELPALEDVDDIASARRVAALAPGTGFAKRLRASGHAADGQQPVAEAAG